MALKLSKLDLIVDDIILKSFNINRLMNESFKMNTEECRIYNHQQKNGTLDDIEKVITQQVPDLWDIESGSMHEPELFKEYSPAFEIGFNTGGYDWGFILKKKNVFNLAKDSLKNNFKFTKEDMADNV
ncbi:hypothetical protein C2G38_2047635 [Gigaspora rosea]|uniref:Uncharacterized protein n=1 Tax=Gigaspora rosea TaxID=44941 RepID=A0A397U9H3_9GLOM|nr:hypothetical protein C2G38_2047635 [Gigaspora rosea]